MILVIFANVYYFLMLQSLNVCKNSVVQRSFNISVFSCDVNKKWNKLES